MMKFFHSLHPFHAATLHSQSFTPTLPLPQLTLTDPISLFGFHFYYRFFNLTHSLISHSPTVSVLHLISLVIITLSIYFRASNFHLLNINVYLYNLNHVPIHYVKTFFEPSHDTSLSSQKYAYKTECSASRYFYKNLHKIY